MFFTFKGSIDSVQIVVQKMSWELNYSLRFVSKLSLYNKQYIYIYTLEVKNKI